MTNYRFCSFAVGTILLLCAPTILAQDARPIIHRFPRAGAQEVSPRTDIGFHARDAFDRSALRSGKCSVVGGFSGRHEVTIRLSRDCHTLVFHPATPFMYGERVRIEMTAQSEDGKLIRDSLSFSTLKRPSREHPFVIDEEHSSGARSAKSERLTLDETLPPMTVTVDKGATPGQIYFANIGFVSLNNDCFLFVADEHGAITRKQILPQDHALDFKIQPNGLRTYYDALAGKFYGMDSTWAIVDSFQIEHGYVPDGHELHVFEDGSYALLGATESVLDMHQYVKGGYDTASITGNVIQVFDRDHVPVFEWRGIDYFNPADAVREDLSSQFIDFQHANSLEFDADRNIIVSNRHLSEITKINGATGEIMWRFGGRHNQFTLVGDSIWFSYQHAVRLLPNGHFLFYDNSNFDTVNGRSDIINESRAVEYELDTVAKIARLIWQYHHSPETYGKALGYVQRLPNGNSLISWGFDSIAMTEINKNAETLFEMTMGADNYTYRAFKYPSSLSDVKEPSSMHSISRLNIKAQTEDNLTLEYSVSRPVAPVTISVFDIMGREVSRRELPATNAGTYRQDISITSLPHGSYFVTLLAGQAAISARFER
jgi:hypothetical protein